MTRQGRTLSCIIAIVAGSQAWALSVGEPQTLSYLSEPLQVHLPVSDWAGAPEPESYRLRLLPDQAYAAYGLSAPQNRPTDLTVQWRREGQNEPYVVIQTQRPITEPILTLLLELRSSKQVAVRQIDLLLDLPAGGQERFSHVASTQYAPRHVVTRPAARIHARTYGPVRPGESLSRIAQKIRPDSGISLARMAGALMQANPEAFIGDAHGLRAGVTLRIPNLSEIRAATPLADLFASAPRRRTAHKQRPATDKSATAFLPRALYTRGRLWALTMEFPSYEAIRPVDLTPKLKALEAKEPILFKADWTLGSIRMDKPQRDSVAQVPAQPSAASLQSETQAQRAPATTPQPIEPESTPAISVAQAVEPIQTEMAPAGNAVLTATSPPQTAKPSEAQSPAAQAESGPATEAPSNNATWWPWLFAVLGLAGGLLWWRRGHFTIAVPIRDDENDAADYQAPATTHAQQADQSSLKEQRAIARLRKRLAPWLQASDYEIQRQAQVAQALLERGRQDQALRLVEELEKAPAPKPQETSAEQVVQKADSQPDNKNPYNQAAEPVDSQPPELQQRKTRERIKALQRKALPEESQRQLKVAEAFFDRGDLVQANSILSGLSTSSDD